MSNNSYVGYIVVAGIVAGGSYFFFKNKIDELNDQVTQLERQKYAEYGVLSSVNRIELAKQPAQYECVHTDDEGFGAGTINYKWSTEYSYGIDVQNYDWKNNVKIDENNVMTITIPKLSQLNPVKVEFDRFIETNPANGDRWERMYKHVVAVGRDWMIKDAENLPYANPQIVATAKSALSSHLLNLLNAKRSQEEQITAINIKFKTPYTTSNAIKFNSTCTKM